MPDKAIGNTSPLLYLHRCGGLGWLSRVFTLVYIPGAVAFELTEGRSRGFDVPNPEDHSWIKIMDPQTTPSEWFAADLGAGEIAAMSLALEHPDYILLLDDALARRTAIAAGLTVWGTLRILLEAKSSGLIESINPVIHRLEKSGMWVSEDIRRRVLALAGES
jgi:predicted nucleic acid-binding protein